MIVVRAPMRISLLGGGTDIPAFHQDTDGAVFSMGINKYVYVMLNDRFGGGIRASYSTTENVDRISDLKNELIRESLLAAGVPNRPDKGLEIVTVSDVPSTGSGLGASSALAVAIASACEIRKHAAGPTNQCHIPQAVMAGRACDVEINRLRHPIGKQDQYGSAISGISLHVFHKSAVITHKLGNQATEVWRRRILPDAMLLYMGPRSASSATGILSSAQKSMPDIVTRQAMADLAKELYDRSSYGDAIGIRARLGAMLNKGWQLKKQLTPMATNEAIDRAIDTALALGADGVKILGAGGGGFMLVLAESSMHPNIADGLGMTRVPYEVDTQGVVGWVI